MGDAHDGRATRLLVADDDVAHPAEHPGRQQAPRTHPTARLATDEEAARFYDALRHSYEVSPAMLAVTRPFRYTVYYTDLNHTIYRFKSRIRHWADTTPLSLTN